MDWNISSVNLLQTYKAETSKTLNTYSHQAHRYAIKTVLWIWISYDNIVYDMIISLDNQTVTHIFSLDSRSQILRHRWKPWLPSWGLILLSKNLWKKCATTPRTILGGWRDFFYSFIQTWFNHCFKCQIIFQVRRKSAGNFQHNNQWKDFGETADFVQKDTKHEIGTGWGIGDIIFKCKIRARCQIYQTLLHNRKFKKS